MIATLAFESVTINGSSEGIEAKKDNGDLVIGPVEVNGRVEVRTEVEH